MSAHEEAIDQFRRRLAGLLFLKHALTFLTVWAFLWGTAVLALRATVGMPRLPLLWGLAGVPAALLPALLLARRRVPAATAVRSLLDRRSGCGGLLMAGGETELGGWDRAMPEVVRPRLRWRGRRAGALLLCAAGFVALAFLVPQRFAELHFGPTLEVGREVERLARQIEVLKQEALLDPSRAKALQEKLEQVREKASGRDPVKTLEALDHLQEMTSRAAKEASQSAARKNEEMSRAETLAESLQKASDRMDPKKLAEAMSELAALGKKAAQENDLLQKRMDPKTKEALARNALNKEGLQRLSRAMKAGRDDLAKRLDRLQKSGLLDREALERLSKCGQCDKEALSRLLEKHAGEMSAREMMEMLESMDGEELAALLEECKDGKGSLAEKLARCKKGGRGGITRGPGEASLTFGKRTSTEGMKFKEQVMPPGDAAALKASKVVGLGHGGEGGGPPEKGGPARSGALAGAAAGGGSASTQVILPRHRGAVERYFDRRRPGK